MTLREAKPIIENMQLAALADSMTGADEKRYQALGVAVEAIEQWINDGKFPTSTQYIEKRKKSISGVERLANLKCKSEKTLRSYIYDAGFCDGYMRKAPKV